LGGTDWNNSKVRVVAKREITDDSKNTEESPPGAEGGEDLPLRAEGMIPMSLPPAPGFLFFLE
jgi:hypothetical protein